MRVLKIQQKELPLKVLARKSLIKKQNDKTTSLTPQRTLELFLYIFSCPYFTILNISILFVGKTAKIAEESPSYVIGHTFGECAEVSISLKKTWSADRTQTLL